MILFCVFCPLIDNSIFYYGCTRAHVFVRRAAALKYNTLLRNYNTNKTAFDYSCTRFFFFFFKWHNRYYFLVMSQLFHRYRGIISIYLCKGVPMTSSSLTLYVFNNYIHPLRAVNIILNYKIRLLLLCWYFIYCKYFIQTDVILY